MSFSGRSQAFLDSTVGNNGFYPDVSLGEFQKLHRVPSNIADDAVTHQVTIAMGAVNIALAETKQHWDDAGHASLDAVDADDAGQRTSFYKAAIYYRAKANLLADFQTFSRRDVADNQAKEQHTTRQLLLAESRKAMRRIKGLTTTIDVELL